MKQKKVVRNVRQFLSSYVQTRFDTHMSIFGSYLIHTECHQAEFLIPSAIISNISVSFSSTGYKQF